MSNPLPSFSPDQVWFTSDTHFGHENIIRFCNRPFRNAEEMNAELIRRWRETVPKDGIVFHLGDFAHGSSRLWNDILNALPGRKYLILGNHDMKTIRQGFMSHFELVAGSAERVPAVAGNRIPPWRAIGYRVRTAC